MDTRIWTERMTWRRFVMILCVIALPFIISSALRYQELTLDFVFFTGLIIIGDLLELRLPFASCTLSGAPIFSAIFLFSREFVISAVVVAAIVEGLIHRKSWLRIILNVAESTITVTLAWTVHWILGGRQVPVLSSLGIMIALAASLSYFMSNFTLISISFLSARNAKWVDVWHDILAPVLPVAPMEGFIAVCLAAAYQAGGLVTFVLFLGLSTIAYIALLSSSMRAKNRDLSARYEDTQAYLRDLVAGMLNGVVAIDAEQKVAMVNRAAEELLDCAAGTLIGRDIAEVREIGGTGLPAMLGEALSSGRGIKAREIELPVAEDRATTVICSVSALRDAAGKPSGAVAVLQDVTEQKEIERRLSHLDRLALMGEFAAGVVHEINKPLALTAMSLDNAACNLEAGDRADVVKDLELARRNLARLEKVSHRLLSFSRPVPMVLDRVDLGEALNEVLDIVAPQARTVRVRVIREVPEGLWLLADASALEQIFLNLAANAIQAMPEGGELRVAAGRVLARVEDVLAGKVVAGEGFAPTGNHAVRVPGEPISAGAGAQEERGFIWVRFSDTGVGMPASAVQKLGHSFFTTKEKGTGLGIAVVCKIMAQYRGVMEVWSKTGAGTVFRLWFPELTAAELKEPDSVALKREPAWKGWTGLSGELPAPADQE